MSKDVPWFRFYPGKFMTGVRGLTPQEVGVYTMLLCLLYEENGPVEWNTLRLSTYCGMRENTFIKVAEKLVALGKISVADGVFTNERAMNEISNRSHDLQLASRAGKASAKKRQQKQCSEATDVERPFNHKIRLDKNKKDTRENARSVAEECVTILSEVASPDVARDFVEHRRQIKKPMTALAARRMVKTLAEHGDADGLLNKTIENGWIGVHTDTVPARPKVEIDRSWSTGTFFANHEDPTPKREAS